MHFGRAAEKEKDKSMVVTLENEQLSVKVSSFGGELQSIVEKETGGEYL